MLQPSNIPLSLYVHIPWCVRKCPYCDFNSHEGQVEEAAYIQALMADLEQDAKYAAGRPIRSVFFGGGTPSLFSPTGIGQILDGAKSRLGFTADCEITLEANPGTVEQARFEGYRAAGVNRLSIGIQSFDADKLKSLGRIHDKNEAIVAAQSARKAGFDNFNLDLMFALPNQTVEQALADIDQALALAPSHISHYHLTLEPNTVFAKYPPANIPDDELAWDIQDACHQRLREAGYENYEVSAWAKPGRQCQHNLNYWQFGDYLGIGAGAHSKLTQADGQIRRLSKKKTPAHYLRDAKSSAVLASNDIVASADIAFEYMLNRLRLNTAVTAAEITQMSGLSFGQLQTALEAAETLGLLEKQADQWQRTELGLTQLNELVSLFMPEGD